MNLGDQVVGGLAVLRRILLGATLTREEGSRAIEAAQCLIERIKECSDLEAYIIPSASLPDEFIRELRAEFLRPAKIVAIPKGGMLSCGCDACQGKSIRCPNCKTISTDPEDIAQKYCGNCRAFHADLVAK